MQICILLQLICYLGAMCIQLLLWLILFLPVTVFAFQFVGGCFAHFPTNGMDGQSASLHPPVGMVAGGHSSRRKSGGIGSLPFLFLVLILRPTPSRFSPSSAASQPLPLPLLRPFCPIIYALSILCAPEGRGDSQCRSCCPPPSLSN